MALQGGVGNPQVSWQGIDPVPRGFPHLRQDARASLLSGLGILPHPLGQVTRPVVHQDSLAFKQVRAGIGCLDPVLDHVRHGRDPVLAEQAAQLLVVERLPAQAGEHQWIGYPASNSPLTKKGEEPV